LILVRFDEGFLMGSKIGKGLTGGMRRKVNE
jgi:hypothetical protein